MPFYILSELWKESLSCILVFKVLSILADDLTNKTLWNNVISVVIIYSIRNYWFNGSQIDISDRLKDKPNTLLKLIHFILITLNVSIPSKKLKFLIYLHTTIG